jgi:hypothetical protein
MPVGGMRSIDLLLQSIISNGAFRKLVLGNFSTMPMYSRISYASIKMKNSLITISAIHFAFVLLSPLQHVKKAASA